MKKHLKLILIGLILISCKKLNLDRLAFPSQKVSEYQFEHYSDSNTNVPSKYSIGSSKVTLVKMTSRDKSTGENYAIYGVYIGDTSTISTDSIILYCHGQYKHMDAYWSRASLLASMIKKYHFGVFMMDYRGFGMSEGESTEEGLYEDVDASIDWLKTMGADPTKTFYYGFSLGAIPVIDRAAYRTDFKPAKIIIESPLASVQNLTHTSTIINVNSKFLSTLEFDNAGKIKDVSAPLLWLHGKVDDYIAIQNGELIFKNHQGSYKEAIRVDHAGHSDIPIVMKYDHYIKTVGNFINL